MLRPKQSPRLAPRPTQSLRILQYPHPTKHTRVRVDQPTIVGERVDRHVYETVQHEVVHTTTIPIDEAHHDNSVYHGMSQLPMISQAESLKSNRHPKDAIKHAQYSSKPHPYREDLWTEKLDFGDHSFTLPPHEQVLHTSCRITSVTEVARRSSAASSASGASIISSPRTPELSRSL
jgi:hypothetical protein